MATGLPRITVITPSLNQGAFIGRTIDSVLGQGYPALEYIVVDGCSRDETLDVLKSYGERLKWVSEQDRGQAHAINKGFQMASGDVLAYLNSDDLYKPGALMSVGRFFACHPEAGWVTGKCRVIDECDREIRRVVTLYKNLWLRLRSYRALQVLDYVSQPATFWHRRVVEKVGLFDETLRYAMDYDYSLRVGRQFRLWVIDGYLASFRVHLASKGYTSAGRQFAEDLAVARRHVSARLPVRLHALHNRLILAGYRLLLAFNERATA